MANGASKVYSIDYAEDVGDDFKTLSKVYPGQLFALKADVTKEQSISEAIDRVLEEAGALHGVVVNAGRTNHKSALDFTTEEIEALFAVNVSFPFPPLLNFVICFPTLFQKVTPLLTRNLAFRSLLHCPGRRPRFYKTKRQGKHCIYGIYG